MIKVHNYNRRSLFWEKYRLNYKFEFHISHKNNFMHKIFSNVKTIVQYNAELPNRWVNFVLVNLNKKSNFKLPPKQ